MSRTLLNDGTARWFDKGTALCFPIPARPGDCRDDETPWTEDALFRTRRGCWILELISEHRPANRRYILLEGGDDEAATLLARTHADEYADFERLPESVRQRFGELAAQHEL